MPLLLAPFLWGVGLMGTAASGSYLLGRYHESEDLAADEPQPLPGFNIALWGLAIVGGYLIYKKVKS